MHGLMQMGSKARYLDEIASFIATIDYYPSLIYEPFAGLAKYSIDSIYKYPVPFICGDINPIYMIAFEYIRQIFNKWSTKTVNDFEEVEDFYEYVIKEIFYTLPNGRLMFQENIDTLLEYKFTMLLHEISEPIYSTKFVFDALLKLYSSINKEAMDTNYKFKDGKIIYDVEEALNSYHEKFYKVTKIAEQAYYHETGEKLLLDEMTLDQVMSLFKDFKKNKNKLFYYSANIEKFYASFMKMLSNPFLAALVISRLSFGALVRTNRDGEYNMPFRYASQEKTNPRSYYPLTGKKFYIQNFLRDCITIGEFGTFHICDWRVFFRHIVHLTLTNKPGFKFENEQALMFIDPPYLKEMTRADATEQEYGGYRTLSLNRSGSWTVDAYREMAERAERAARRLVASGIAAEVLILICHSRHTFLINKLCGMGYGCHFYERSRRHEFRSLNSKDTDSESHEVLFWKIIK